MFVIACPWCGPREEEEFRCGGLAHVPYPSDTAGADDATWAGVLYLRDNPKGWLRERWFHAAGCRMWFNAIRHTVTYEFAMTYTPSDEPPPLPEEPR